MLRLKIESELFQLHDLKTYETNPLLYVNYGDYFEYVLKAYAGIEQRLHEMGQWMAGLDAFYATAVRNLAPHGRDAETFPNLSPALIDAALAMGEGFVAVYETFVREFDQYRASEGKGGFDTLPVPLQRHVLAGRDVALAALKGFLGFLTEVKPRATGCFKLGRERLRKQLRVDGVTLSMEEVLALNQANLDANSQVRPTTNRSIAGHLGHRQCTIGGHGHCKRIGPKCLARTGHATRA